MKRERRKQIRVKALHIAWMVIDAKSTDLDLRDFVRNDDETILLSEELDKLAQQLYCRFADANERLKNTKEMG